MFQRLSGHSILSSLLPSLLNCLLVILCLGAIAGCTPSPLSDRFFPGEPVDVSLTIDTVEATESAGAYRLTGRTNLPEDTELTLAAVRSLTPEKVASFNREPSYALLDRQTTLVRQGAWEVTLNLWQVAPSGQYQEAWQLDSATLSPGVKPSETVLFQASLEPTRQTEALSEALQRSQIQLQGELVRFTPDGEFYVYASQSLAIALPTGRTTPPTREPTPPPAPVTAPQPQPTPITLDATSAPLSPQEMLQ